MFFLGEIFVDLPLPTTPPVEPHCGRCTACIDVCPTQAIVAPGVVDARRCISYLTIEHEGPIDEALRPLLGNRIYGCDDCLAVCPWNKFAQASQQIAFAPKAGLDAPALAELATLDDAGFRQRFAGTAIKRIGRDRFLRNVAYALGNSAAPATSLPALERLINDNSAVVRDAALWALSRLSPPVPP
jgi:epoxyqueuosine reductase